MAGILRYRIQPVGIELPDDVGADDMKAAQRGIRVFDSLEDLWRALLSDDGAGWQPEIVAVEREPATRCAKRGQEGPSAVQGNGAAGRRGGVRAPKPAERVVQRCGFMSWKEMREIAKRIHVGETSVEDRQRLGWSMPVLTDQGMQDAEARRRRPCAPLPAEDVQGWMDKVIECLICGRKHSRGAGCGKDVLDAIDRAGAADRDPPPIDRGRSCQRRHGRSTRRGNKR